MWPLRRHRPALSVVVVAYNMAREAPRTLLSLSVGYQRHISADDYEVIVVDNGSTTPLDAKIFENLTGNFRLIRIDPAPPSPAHAVNRGLAEARGKTIGVMIDGARIVTPGLLHFARNGVQLYRRAVVATLGWYLGRDLQRWSIETGYDHKREDEMLASIGWPNDGYRLFEIAASDESTVDGWLGQIEESNALFLSRESWDLLGGMDERFDMPGGGYLNLDTLARAIELPNSEFVVLLGEGTFHQIHGGIATNQSFRSLAARLGEWEAQYQAIRKRPWRTPLPQNRTFVGPLPQAVLPQFARSLVEPARGQPLGPSFDQSLWLPSSSPRPADPVCAALVDVAENELRARRFEASAAVARLARGRAPDEPAPQRLLATVGAWLRDAGVPPDQRRDRFHLARAKAYGLLGDTKAAEAEFRTALAWNADLTEAHISLAELRFPGEGYLSLLARFHADIKPSTYLEIGVGKGHSLALARAPTLAIGVDPSPVIEAHFTAPTRIFAETSDDFFARHKSESLPEGWSIDLAFIDGVRLFEQVLRDFINVERYCHRRSVVLIHDTVPLDEPTQRRERSTNFHTGDVWKAVPCLRHYRPDLNIVTIATPPSGLTLITRLDPMSAVLADHYDEAVAKFIHTPFSAIENRSNEELAIVPNAWDAVVDLLPKRQAIVVLGMHRSGTSATAGVLSGLGAATPKKTLMGPDPNNQRGYFESFDLAETHNEMLASIGSSWRDWRKLDPQWTHSPAAARYREKIKAVLAEEFGDERMILLKDPRICRFFPFILSILTDLKSDTVVILTIRNPLEVARSLRRRNDIALPESILLWLRYVLDAEYYTRGLPRYFLPYEGFLLDWRHHAARIAETTGVDWPRRSNHLDAEIDEFLTTVLHHERATLGEVMDHPEVLEPARHAYKILSEICSHGESQDLLDRLDAVRIQFDECQICGEAPAAEASAAANE